MQKFRTFVPAMILAASQIQRFRSLLLRLALVLSLFGVGGDTSGHAPSLHKTEPTEWVFRWRKSAANGCRLSSGLQPVFRCALYSVRATPDTPLCSILSSRKAVLQVARMTWAVLRFGRPKRLLPPVGRCVGEYGVA